MSWRTHMSWGYVLKISTHTFKTYITVRVHTFVWYVLKICLEEQICLEDMSWNIQHIPSRHIKHTSVWYVLQICLEQHKICLEDMSWNFQHIFSRHTKHTSVWYVLIRKTICLENMSGTYILTYVLKMCLTGMSWNNRVYALHICLEIQTYMSWMVTLCMSW